MHRFLTAWLFGLALLVAGATAPPARAQAAQPTAETMAKSPCSGHGLARDGRCFCEPGWSGPICATREAAVSCGPHGVAEHGRCFCEAGWTGSSCDRPVAVARDCNGHGRMREGRCFCEPGWSGATCAVEQRTITCVHGLAQDGRCFCEAGWGGARCASPVR